MPRRQVVFVTVAATLLCAPLTGCSSSRGDLEITNNSDTSVEVSTGEDVLTVDAGGAASILDSGCTTGDVTVTFSATERVRVLPGPVCPPDTVVISDGEVTLASPK
jgi:uncharacterized cupin superfamily protein